METQSILNSTTTIVAAFAANNRMTADELQEMLKTTYGNIAVLTSASFNDALTGAVERSDPISAFPPPATTARKSLANPDHIISMIDGKPYKTLRRHLSTHGLTPEQYRERYDLRPDYPMVAKTYSESRRDMAKKIGLGRKPRGNEPTVS